LHRFDELMDGRSGYQPSVVKTGRPAHQHLRRVPLPRAGRRTSFGGRNMIAQVGDRIVVEGTQPGEHRRVGVITAVGQNDGSPPYRVRWRSDGRTTLIFPGPEARIEPRPTTAAAR
jgi:hypothetical protein